MNDVITRAWRALVREGRIVWLRYRIRQAEQDIRYEAGSIAPNIDQINAWRRDAGAWRVEVLTLENERQGAAEPFGGTD